MSVFGEDTFKQEILNSLEYSIKNHGKDNESSIQDILEVIRYLINPDKYYDSL